MRIFYRPFAGLVASGATCEGFGMPSRPGHLYSQWRDHWSQTRATSHIFSMLSWSTAVDSSFPGWGRSEEADRRIAELHGSFPS